MVFVGGGVGGGGVVVFFFQKPFLAFLFSWLAELHDVYIQDPYMIIT